MFNIGDKVVYPMHGAGTIVGIEKKEILGQIKEYYTMKMPIGDMQVMIPVDSIKTIGVRFIVKDYELEEVIKALSSEIEVVSGNWNKRYRENLEKIKSGNISEVALVIKELCYRDREKGLSTGERKMLNNARQILISEISLVKGIKSSEVEKLMSDLV